MKRKRFIPIVLAAACLFMAVAAGCSGGSSGSAQVTASGEATAAPANDVVTLGINTLPVNFNTMERSDDAVLDLFFLPILTYTDEGSFRMMLAESVTTEDNQTYTIHLRQNALWSDGEAVTADDVLYTLNTMCSPDFSSNIKSRFYIFEGVNSSGNVEAEDGTCTGWSKTDDYTVQMKTDSPCNEYMVYNTLSVLRPVPSHVLVGVDIAQLSTNELFQTPTVSDGAYLLETYESGQYMQLKANENYCLGAPKIQTLVIKILSASNMSAQLETGEIDANITSISYDDYVRMSTLTNITTVVSSQPYIGRILFINTEHIPDKTVRQAISYALNRAALNEAVMAGTAIPVTGPYLSNNLFYDMDIETPTYDLEKAKELLAESGFNQHIVLSSNNSNESTMRLAEMTVNQLSEAGFDIELAINDHATVLANARAGDFDLVIFGYGLSPVDPDVSFLVRSTGSFNLPQYNNPEVDTLLDQGLAEVDTDARMAIYQELASVVNDDMPITFYYGESYIFSYSNNLISFTPRSFGFFSDVEIWEIR